MRTLKIMTLVLVTLIMTSSKKIDILDTSILPNRYGAVCVANNLNCNINYTYKWGKSGKWQSVCLRPNNNMTHTYIYTNRKCVSPEFFIRFDYDLSTYDRYKEYCLSRYASWDDECDNAYSYVFKKKGTSAFELYDCEK